MWQMARRGITKRVLSFDRADETPTNGSKTSLLVSATAAQRPPALPILVQRLGKPPENSLHRGNLQGNSHSQTVKARDTSRPAPAPNSPIPQNPRRNLKKKSPPQIQQLPYLLLSRRKRKSTVSKIRGKLQIVPNKMANGQWSFAFSLMNDSKPKDLFYAVWRQHKMGVLFSAFH